LLAPERIFASSSLLQARRYGPSDVDPSVPDPSLPPTQPTPSVVSPQKTQAFQTLIDKIAAVTDPQHVPSLLTQHVDLILSFDSAHEISTSLDSILQTTRLEQGDDAAQQTEEIMDMIVTFAHDFVEQAAQVHDTNRKLLGKIILAMSDKTLTGFQREEALDLLLAKQKDNLTPGFLRHVAGECERIQNAPKTTPESLRLMESLRVIQARVVDEIGQDLGEAAQVIMQLIGYDAKGERLAILDAGLVVRGCDFAQELVEATDEALQGFQSVPGGADSELVQRVQEINERARQFIRGETMSFQ
jgi:hypothetical protein